MHRDLYKELCSYENLELAYAKHANTYKIRKKLVEEIEMAFPNEISTKEINRITKYNLPL